MRFLATVLLLLGTVCVARAQVNAPTLMIDKGNVAQDFSATSAARAELVNSLAVADTLSQPAAKPANALGAPGVATALVVPVDRADPAPGTRCAKTARSAPSRRALRRVRQSTWQRPALSFSCRISGCSATWWQNHHHASCIPAFSPRMKSLRCRSQASSQTFWKSIS